MSARCCTCDHVSSTTPPRLVNPADPLVMAQSTFSCEKCKDFHCLTCSKEGKHKEDEELQ